MYDVYSIFSDGILKYVCIICMYNKICIFHDEKSAIIRYSLLKVFLRNIRTLAALLKFSRPCAFATLARVRIYVSLCRREARTRARARARTRMGE